MAKITEPQLERNRQRMQECFLIDQKEYPANCNIYRVFRLKYFMKMIKESRNVLTKPKLWDDPFENIVFNSTTFQVESEKHISYSYVHERFYGQCWTLNKDETDALWRIYSPKKDGIRVRTTIAKLFSSIYDCKKPGAFASFFIGKVRYWEEREIRRYLRNGFLGSNILNYLWTAWTLLIKRKEFSHENEIRLLYIESRIKKAEKNNIYSYDVDINTVFDEILFDPRFNNDEYKKFRNEIEALGFKGKIRKSRLYAVPHIIANII